MTKIILYILLIGLVSFAVCVPLTAQQIDTVYFKNYQHLPDGIQPLKNKINPLNPFASDITMHSAGITTSDGHTYFIRIKEPDLSKLAPMPGANLKHLEEPQPLQRGTIPLRHFPKNRKE